MPSVLMACAKVRSYEMGFAQYEELKIKNEGYTCMRNVWQNRKHPHGFLVAE